MHTLSPRTSFSGFWVTGWTLTSSAVSVALCSAWRPSPGVTDTGWLTSYSLSLPSQVVVLWTGTTSTASKFFFIFLIHVKRELFLTDTFNFRLWEISWRQTFLFLLSTISWTNGGEIWGEIASHDIILSIRFLVSGGWVFTACWTRTRA